MTSLPKASSLNFASIPKASSLSFASLSTDSILFIMFVAAPEKVQTSNSRAAGDSATNHVNAFCMEVSTGSKNIEYNLVILLKKVHYANV